MRHYYYHDTRKERSCEEYPVKLVLVHGKARLYCSTGIKVSKLCWDATTERVVNHPLEQAHNIKLGRIKTGIDELCLAVFLQKGPVDEDELKSSMMRVIKGEDCSFNTKKTLFMQLFKSFADAHTPSTKKLYYSTARRIRAFDAKCDRLGIENITYSWLKSFEAFLATTAPSANARAIHLRNIRAVFNDAISREIITKYPFHRFKIKQQPTIHRALSAKAVQTIASMPVLEWERQYRDLWMLMFLLCGISPVDLCHLKDMQDGRIVYRRSKTGQPLNIKVEPEALEIIERYRGEKWLLNILDRNRSGHLDWVRRMDRNLKTLGGVTMERHTSKDGKQRLVAVKRKTWPRLSAYWARHTWASVAASLDIPRETIARALGHSQRSVTDIYIDFDQRKVDEANRRVIDWVLYNKR